MKVRVGTNYTLYFLVIISPLLSLLFDKTTFYYVVGPLISLLLVSTLIKKYSKTIVLISILSICCVLWAVLTAYDFGKIYNHTFSFFNTVVLFFMFSLQQYRMQFYVFFKKHISLIKMIIFIIIVVEGYLLLTRNGFQYKYSWGGAFFHGTSSMPHTLSYLMMITMVLCMLIAYEEKKKWFLAFTIIPIYSIYESGARSTLVAVVLLCLIMLDMIFPTRGRKIIKKVIIATFWLSIVLFMLRGKIMQSDLWNKIMLRNNSGNSSAGRFYIWSDLIYQFFHNSNIIQYFFGQGDSMTYYYNQQNQLVRAQVWAHNDWIQILVGKGLMGISVYCYGFVSFCKYLWKQRYSYTKWIIFGLIIFLMIGNGFYTYRDTSLGIPFFTLLMIYSEDSYLERNKGAE